MANRVVAGAVIAAFVVAAALFSGAPHGATLWGHPLLTIVFSDRPCWVGIGMLRRDLPQRRNGRRWTAGDLVAGDSTDGSSRRQIRPYEG
jgi:ubiquinone biosynthesis protein